MKQKPIVWHLTFGWTVLTFLLDFAMIVIGGATDVVSIVLVVSIELLSIWIAYKLLMGKRWALITMTVYYGLRSFNFYFEEFSFYSKSGLNIELSLNGLIGVNVPTVILFALLLVQLRRRPALESSPGL